MTDEEIKTEAQSLILKAYKCTPKPEKSEEFRLTENEKGELAFLMEFERGVMGNGTFLYSPQPFVENLIRERENEKNLAIAHSQATFEIVNLLWKEKIETICVILVQNLHSEFDKMICEQGVFAYSIICEATMKTYGHRNRSFELNKVLKKNADYRAKVKNHYVEKIKNRRAAPQIIFHPIYELQKQLWQEVRRYYRDTKKYYLKVKNPKDALLAVKEKYPHLPSDLVERLAGLDAHFSREPGKIALFAVARLTNPPSKLNVSSLQKYLSASKKLQATVPEKEIYSMVLDFLKKAKQENIFANYLQSIRHDK